MKREEVYNYFETIGEEEFRQNYQELQNSIHEKGFSFEGREFPYSLKPLLITQDEESYFKETSELLLEVLEIVLESYYTDDFVKSFFINYDCYKDLLAVHPSGKKIVISRYDTVWYGGKDYKIFECNTCCPGGISILGTIKMDYKKLPVVQKTFISSTEFICDQTKNFINALIEYSKSNIHEMGSMKQLGIAFANYDNVYTYELKEFCECSKSMGHNAIICDLKDLKQNAKDGKIYFEDIEINIVYNKADPLKLDSLLIQDLINAIRDKKIVSINSFPAMFITESKIVLALLWNKHFQEKYLTEKQIEIIKKHIPCSLLLREGIGDFYDEKVENVIEFAKSNKDRLVLKIDNDTRGNNIYIGHSIDHKTWNNMIDLYKNKNWIIQEYCKIPEISIPEIDKKSNELIFPKKKYGIDFMMYNGKYAGIVSRISEKEIINVGSGGCEQPVFVTN